MAGVVRREGACRHQVGAGLQTTIGGSAKDLGALGVAAGYASHTGETEPGLLAFQEFPEEAGAWWG